MKKDSFISFIMSNLFYIGAAFILVVMFISVLVGAVVDKVQYERRREDVFCEMYIKTIHVDQTGYEISYQEGIKTCSYNNVTKTILDDGQTVLKYVNDKLLLEKNGERKDIGFDFLVDNSQKFCKVVDYWDEYNKIPIEERQRTLGKRAFFYVCTDGVDIFYIYGRTRKSIFKWKEGNIYPSLFKYDLSEDKVLYLGYYPNMNYQELDLSTMRMLKA